MLKIFHKYQWMGIVFVLADLVDCLLSIYVFKIEPQYGICFAAGLILFIAGTAIRIKEKRQGSGKKS